MTNAELYFDDENTVDNFIGDFCEFAEAGDIEFKHLYLKETLERFFKTEAKIEKVEVDPAIFTEKKYEFEGVKFQ